jgi:CBS domain-containing protein
MRTPLLCLALAACTSLPTTPPSPRPVRLTNAPPAKPKDPGDNEPKRIDPVLPGVGYLDGRHLDGREPTRFARLEFHDALYAAEPTPASEPIAKSERQPAHVSLPVVEERPESVRVLTDDEGIRLVGYVRHRDLHRVVRHRARAWLGADPRPALGTGSEGVWLRPGQVVAGSGPLQRATLDDPMSHGTAWVDGDAVDWVYEPDAGWREAFTPGAALWPGQVITTRDGATLATVPPGVEVGVAILTREGDRARVRYESEHLLIEGFVPVGALDESHAPLPPQHGFGFTGGWGVLDETRYLHEGDMLHAGPGGEVIGLVTERRVLFIVGDRDDRGLAVRGHTRTWGFASLWVPASVVTRSDVWEATIELRTRLEPLPGGGPVPRLLVGQQPRADACWAAHLATGATQPLTIRLAWSSSGKVEVLAPAQLDDPLRTCLVGALQVSSSGPRETGSFELQLEPLPLPPAVSASPR